MKLKQRIYQLDLSDTDLSVYLHNPSVQVFDRYVQKMQSFNKVSELFAGLSSGVAVSLSDETKKDVWEIVTMVADLVEDGKRRSLNMDEAQQLTIWDCVCIVKAMNVMTENALNPTPAAATTQTAERLT